MNCRAPLAAIALLAALPAQDPKHATQRLREDLVQLASDIEAISYGEFVWGRFGSAWKGAEPDLDRLRELGATLRSADPALSLLGDADPKVRTLALLLLFDREEPQWLPRIASFVGDGAAAIPGRMHGNVAFDGGRMIGQPWIVTPCTVGDVARQLLERYYAASGPAHRAAHGSDPVQRFDAWWQPRRERPHGACFLRIRFQRATGGSSPVRDNVAAGLQEVRRAVDARPSPEREWLLLALPDAGEPDLDAFASDAERVAAAKRLGDEALLAALDGRVPGDDPDLAALLLGPTPSGGPGPLPTFVLDPTRRIFAEASAARLLELERAHRARPEGTPRYAGPGWVTTAASLDPARATGWLLAGLDRFARHYESWDRAQVVLALARVDERAAERAFVQHFWGPEMTAYYGAQTHGCMLDGIVDLPADKADRLFQELVDAEGFAACGPPTAIAFARALARRRGAEVLAEDEIGNTHHPFGLHALANPTQIEAARQAHPAETARVLEATARWRDAIRRAVGRR